MGGKFLRVKILQHVPGLLDGHPFPAEGAEVTLPAGLAISLINDRRAELLGGPEGPSKASAAAPETRKATRARKTV